MRRPAIREFTEMLSTTHILQGLSAALALLATIFAILANRVQIPNEIKKIDLGYIDENKPKPVDDLDRLTSGLSRQKKLTTVVVYASFFSAVFSLLALALSLCVE
jgi:hypothetical protein